MKLFISFNIFEKNVVCGPAVAHWLYFATHSQRWPTSVLLSGKAPFLNCFGLALKDTLYKASTTVTVGQLFYIIKSVCPARIFLNRMLELLHPNHDKRHIVLTQNVRLDVRWFDSFLVHYRNISVYNHWHYTVSLDACLDGLGAVWENHVHIPSH